MANSFLIGQRVVVDNEIVTCIEPPRQAVRMNSESIQWIRFSSGMEQWRSVLHIKPLPNGQL